MTNTYIEAIGRRKTSIARVRIEPAGRLSYTINNQESAKYFPTETLQEIINEAFATSGKGNKFRVTAVIKGGGINSQAEALRLGISRALVKSDSQVRQPLKKAGFLKRDPRAKERRKFGLKKARRAPQWSKR